MAICLPRPCLIASLCIWSRSLPGKRACPETPPPRASPMIDRQVTLLPEPDSPTIPRVWPRSREKLTPSTALTMPSSVLNRTRRSFTSSSAMWPLRASYRLALWSGVPHPRIEHRVEDVHNEVEHHHEEGGEQDHALDHGQVVVDDRLHGGGAHPRQAEYPLGDDRAAEQDADVQAQHGDHRRERGPQDVLDDHAPLAQALGPGGADVVLTHDLEHVAAHHARVQR